MARKSIGPQRWLDRTEYIRLIQESLHRLGYSGIAGKLEQQSGIEMQPDFASRFQRAVSSGDWQAATDLLPRLVTGAAAEREAKFIILRQKYTEMVDASDQVAALECLRHELAPLCADRRELHQLAVMLLSPRELSAGAEEDLTARQRAKVLEQIQRLTKPSTVVPEGRLELLVEQALGMQLAGSVFYHGGPVSFSLFKDLSMGPEQLPSRTMQVLEVHRNEVWHLQFSHNGRMIASGGKDCWVVIWELDSTWKWVHKHTLQGQEQEVTHVSWSPDDTMLLVCCDGGRCILWDTATGRLLKTLQRHVACTVAGAWLPDGKRLVTASHDARTIIWNTDGEVVSIIKDLPVNDLAVSADGKYMLRLSSGILKVQQLPDGAEVEVLDADATSLCLSGDDVLLDTKSNSIDLWSLENVRRRLERSAGAGDAGRSPREDEPEKSSFNAIANFHRPPPLLDRKYVIRSCFGGLGNEFVASGSADCQVFIWHRKTQEMLQVLHGHLGVINAVAWNPVYPHMMASASDDCTVRVWVAEAAAACSG